MAFSAPNPLGQRIGHFRVPPEPLYQNDFKCSAFDMKMIFHSHASKTHFHKKGCAPSLILKVRVFRTRKWPVVPPGAVAVHALHESCLV